MGLPELTSTKWIVWGRRAHPDPPEKFTRLAPPLKELTVDRALPDTTPFFSTVDDVIERLAETGYLSDKATRDGSLPGRSSGQTAAHRGPGRCR